MGYWKTLRRGWEVEVFSWGGGGRVSEATRRLLSFEGPPHQEGQMYGYIEILLLLWDIVPFGPAIQAQIAI